MGIIALTTAFLVGTVVVLFAVSSQSAAIADQYGSTQVVTLNGADGEMLYIAQVRDGTGERQTVVGIPSGVDGLPAPPETGVRGPVEATTEQSFTGDRQRLSLTVRPSAEQSSLPASWYVTDVETAEQLGVTRTLTLRTTSDAVPEQGSPIPGALAFFLAGTEQIVTLLVVAWAGASVLVGILVYSVTKMSVRDRRAAIHVVRATGGSSRSVTGLFAARAGGLTLVGVALGYSIGVILPNLLANIAVVVGAPIALSLSLNATSGSIISGLLVGVTLVGTVAGALAVWSDATCLPARIGERRASRLERLPALPVPSAFRPKLLSWRAFVPTAGALTVFIIFVLITASLGTALVPVTDGGGSVTQAGSQHPFSSRLSESYGESLQASGTAASPEVLLFLTSNSRPFIARGVDFEAFQSVTGAEIRRGRAPNGTDEAVIGADLARALDVDVGETMALGGSTTTALTTVDIVGTYGADGVVDDQLLLSLDTGRHLRGMDAGAVNLIRVSEFSTSTPDEQVVVLDVEVPSQVRANGTVMARIRLRNVGSADATRTLPVEFDETTREVEVTLSGGETTTERISIETGAIGEKTLSVADTRRTIAVGQGVTGAGDGQTESGSAGPFFVAVPDRGPPNASLALTVVDREGRSVGNATVTVGDQTAQTNSQGKVSIALPQREGTYNLTASVDNRSTTRRVAVAPNSTRQLLATVTRPGETSVFSRPTAAVRLSNPWNETLNQTLKVVGPTRSVTRDVSMAPGQTRTITTRLNRRSPGEYQVQAFLNDELVGERTYQVTGDDRIAGALAGTGRYQQGSSLTAAAERVFGNFGFLLAVLVGLGALMTIGSTIAAFAGAVHARSHPIGVRRATGASPGQLARLILADALRIALPATLLAFVLASVTMLVLGQLGLLVVFGISLSPTIPLWAIVGIAGLAVGLALLSAGVVVLSFTRRQPASLFATAQ